MKAYIHSFEGRPWNEDCEAAYNGFTKLGIECVLFSSNEELEQRSEEDIVVGGMLIMEHVFNELEIKLPVYNYPEELNKYLGRQIKVIKLKDLNEDMLPIFIKPVEEKIAKGIVVESLEDLKEYELLDPETEIICSEPVRFVSEWRCFVRYGEVIGIQFYNGDVTIKPDNKIIDTAVREYISIPAACSLDFGVTEEGNTILIEMNDGFSIGAYGLNDELYSKFLMARWAELLNIPDPLDSRFKSGYVETFISEEKERVDNAYLQIEINTKTGNEVVPKKLINTLKNMSGYEAIVNYLENTSDKDLYITDDYISFESSLLHGIFYNILGKRINIHICVKESDVEKIKQMLYDSYLMEVRDTWTFIKWRYAEKNYVIQLFKRLSFSSEYFLRLYEDGNGVIIYCGDEDIKIKYFKIKYNLNRKILFAVKKKNYYILNHPREVFIDDRDSFSVHLSYNLYKEYPDADKRLGKYEGFELKEYSEEEYKIKLAKLILSAPEIKKYWMKLHIQEDCTDNCIM